MSCNCNKKDMNLYFAKVKKEAIIPSKRDCDMGYDIYACFEDDIKFLMPHETAMIPTGIASACSFDFGILLKERGSTGTKGIGQRCGVIEGSFRGEWFVPITNENNDKIIAISKLSEEETKAKFACSSYDIVYYPYTKAICQAIVIPIPKMNIQEISYEDLQKIESERGIGALGSSGK